MLTQEEIKKFEKTLETNKARLEKEVGGLDTPVDFGDGLDPYEETVDEDEEFENRNSASDELRRQLIEIQIALAKIVDNKYGICEKCKEEITKEILEAAPESRLCKSCKAER